MKKHFFKLLLIAILVLIPFGLVKAETLSKKLSGKILLQVESRGEAWYVNPTNSNRYYMADGSAAYNVMRSLGVGITNSNLSKLQNNKNLAKKQSGKIFLQVEDRGQAYYINSDGTLHYLKNGDAAYGIMRSLGLGITNTNLSKISEAIPSPSHIYQDNQNSQYTMPQTTATTTLDCSSNWQCGTWSTCTDSQQTRFCNDLNYCGNATTRPSEARSCNSTPAPVSYSDYILKYYIDSNSTNGHSGLLNVKLIADTSRDIRIKKVVVNATNMTTSQTVGIFGSTPNYHILNQASNNNWEYNSEFQVSGNPFSVFLSASGSYGENAILTASFNNWEAWDYTSNKPVRLELTTAPVLPNCSSANYDSTYINSVKTAVQNDQLETIKSMVANYPCGHLQELLDTTLVESAWRGKTDIAQYILQQSAADVDTKTQSFSALYEASGNGNLDIAQLLLNKGADPNRLGYGGISPLSISLGDSFNITLFQLLLDKGANANLADNCGKTPLHMSAQTGKNDGMALLLSHGANVNAKQCSYGENYTPLMNAVASNNINGVELLVQNGADMTAISTSNETALMIATRKGYTAIADFLRLSGATN